MGKFLIIISGIGTGGHYFPALVVAQEFVKSNFETIFLTRKGFPEEEMAKRYGLKTFYIKPQPFYGKSLLNKLTALWKVVESVLKLIPITKRCVGISFGGFGSLPLILSCIINHQPFFLFEPNCMPGRTTRMFARLAKKVFLGLPSAKKMKGDIVLTGIPVRPEFKRFSQKEISSAGKTILFMGGSQGARRLNEVAINFQRILPKDFRIIIISGKRDFEWVAKEKDFRTEVISFTAEPWKVISQADVVISRAGALSGYELLTMQKSVIFVPFPYAVDDHQYYNALFFNNLPNVKMILEKDLNEKILLELVMDLLDKRKTETSKGRPMIFDAEKIIVHTVRKELA